MLRLPLFLVSTFPLQIYINFFTPKAQKAQKCSPYSERPTRVDFSRSESFCDFRVWLRLPPPRSGLCEMNRAVGSNVEIRVSQVKVKGQSQRSKSKSSNMSKNVRNRFATDFDGKDTTLGVVQGLLISITNPSRILHSMNQEVMEIKR